MTAGVGTDTNCISAQESAENRKARRWTSGGYPLSGLIRCAQCGHAYIGGGGSKNYRNPSDPDRYRFYKDSGGPWEREVCPGRLGTVPKRWLEPHVIDTIARLVAHPSMQARIAAEIDRVIASSDDAFVDEQSRLERDRDRLAAERDRLVTAIARGVVSEDEARPMLTRLRDEQATTGAAIERLRFRGRSAGRLALERDELVALAADFGARAREATGPVLRDLLRPWLADAVIDKEARTLTLAIRRIPAVGPFLPAFNQPGQDEHWQETAAVVQRMLRIPARNPLPGRGVSKSAEVRRRRRAAG